MKGFDVLKIKSAVKNHNKFDLSRTHLTTMEFGEIVPLLAEETVPGDKFSVNGMYFSRLAPLVKPTYGKFSFKTVAGYVPYHMIAADSEAWFAGKTAWEGQTPVGRWFTVKTLHDFIVNTCVTTTGATSANSVYTYVDSAGTPTYNVYDGAGKYYVKILNALGYALPSNVNLQSGSQWNITMASVKLSAYPLLAYFKLYNDYMSQSQRFNSSQLSRYLNAIKYKISISGAWVSSTGEILYTGMQSMFYEVNLNYENDYFTSAWQTPNNPINSIENIGSVTVPEPVPGQSANIITDSTSNNYFPSSVVTQRALDFLKSFDNWVRRNNYSGSRAVQQVYSRFGIKTSDFRDHYAHVLGTDVIPVTVGDITSNASTDIMKGGNTVNIALGDYAGKGIMNGSKGISMQADDYGLLLILGYFTVTPMNGFGNDRKVLRTAPLDYYNPEFDGLGADAISCGEYFSDPTDYSTGTFDNSVFGYTERYNAYRYGRDQITGEFRDYTTGGEMNVWHTGRNMSAIRKAGNLVAQSKSVNTMPQKDSEYNRIFSAPAVGSDHFYLTAQFAVDAIRPMLNLNQVVNLGEGDTNVPRNGNVIS